MEKIKDEFNKKLLKLGIKRRYMKNFKNNCTANVEGVILSLNKENTFKSFIYGSFVWEKTPEGYEYWSDISKK